MSSYARAACAVLVFGTALVTTAQRGDRPAFFDELAAEARRICPTGKLSQSGKSSAGMISHWAAVTVQGADTPICLVQGYWSPTGLALTDARREIIFHLEMDAEDVSAPATLRRAGAQISIADFTLVLAERRLACSGAWTVRDKGTAAAYAYLCDPKRNARRKALLDSLARLSVER
jgi:hypothetical protein